MNKDIERIRDENAAWIDSVWEKLTQKMPYALSKAREFEGFPYTVRGGEWAGGPEDGASWWTNGFWPAAMWQMYLHTNDERYREEAQRAEGMLDEAFFDFDRLHHDVGFLWLISSGVNFRLTGCDLSRKRTLAAANLLAGRFNPAGFIRAWNEHKTGWAIIDTMMNLNLLYWASDFTGDPRFRKIAVKHADTVIEHFIRDDGSSEHIVVFDPETGAPAEKLGGQGYAAGTSWSRGQGWALYGFTLTYTHTCADRYLDTARRIANYFVDNLEGRDNWIPRCDFRQPDEPAIVDDIAGGLGACALIELSSHVPQAESARYFNAAMCILKDMEKVDADWSNDSPAILRRCTGAYHGEHHRHIPMQYGDYFFIEALAKLRGEKLRFW